MHIANKYIE